METCGVYIRRYKISKKKIVLSIISISSLFISKILFTLFNIIVGQLPPEFPENAP